MSPKGIYPRKPRTPRAYPPDLVESVRRLYGDGASQVEVGAALGVSQRVVWRLMARHGIARRPRIKREQRGSKNSSWKGGRSISAAGYVLALAPDHPRAACGYVFEHILVMERHLGRRLVWRGTGHPDSEIVHHIDGNKQNNIPSNLRVEKFDSHLSIHRDPVTGQNGGGGALCP
jgi:hypothetical protein